MVISSNLNIFRTAGRKNGGLVLACFFTVSITLSNHHSDANNASFKFVDLNNDLHLVRTI